MGARDLEFTRSAETREQHRHRRRNPHTLLGAKYGQRLRTLATMADAAATSLARSSEHRLAAVVFVDVVGFSRMMANDEEGTLAALRAHRNVTDSVVLNHGGRIVKGTGDGTLLEFASATAALRAAVEVQDLMRSRNQELPK